MRADLVVRGGTVIDGSGSPSRRADVAITDGTIVHVGDDVGHGRRELDASGLLVTPGFVDPHTHFDGQATWDPLLQPSSQHGVTSVAMGNCGVGFAPVAPGCHSSLVEMMEGVEDIPGTALHEGLRWDWRSFPEYLDSLERQARVLDVGAHLPHAALRFFVMGGRGADPAEHPDDGELQAMERLTREGLAAGALGVSTSRTALHRTSRGANLGTLRAEARELLALAGALAAERRGVVQLLSDAYCSPDEEFAAAELDLIGTVARACRRPLSFTVQQSPEVPDRWRALLTTAEGLRSEGFDVRAQVAPRPIGVLLGLEATTNPFSPCRQYRAVAGLPLSERLAALREPDRREAILRSHRSLTSGPDAFPGLRFLGRFEDMYLLDDPVDYDLGAASSIAERARRAGADPTAFTFDALLSNDGRQLLYVPVFNYAERTLDAIRSMISSPAALFGLSDAGAHCGQICDASMTTTYLTLWGRDVSEPDRLPLERVVREVTRRPAEHLGWLDRGMVAPGYLADINVIDLERLGCARPRIVNDLPAGGRRLVQDASGYRWTVKRGSVTFEDGEPTGELPGRLLRGGRPDQR